MDYSLKTKIICRTLAKKKHAYMLKEKDFFKKLKAGTTRRFC